MHVDRRASIRLLAGAALVALAACRTPSTDASDPVVARRPRRDPEDPPITSVVIVGDSITQGSAQALEDTLVAGGIPDVRVEGKAKRRIEVGNGNGSEPLNGFATVYGLVSEGVAPSAWVIELGTNDVGGYPDAAAYGALIDSILEVIPAEAPLVWVNTFRSEFPDDTNMFNMVLQQRIDDRGNATVADWFSIASAPDEVVLQDDHLHPNKAGQQVLALLVLQALQRL